MATVLNAMDAASLSAAIDTVNAGGGSGGPYTINITQSIALTTPLAPILNSVTINGGSGISVSGGGTTRIFMVGVDTATQTSPQGNPANITSVVSQSPVVAINNLILSQGLAKGGDGGNGGGGGLGAGGALFVNQSAQVTLTDVTDPPPPEWSALWYGLRARRTDRCRGRGPSLRRLSPSCARRRCWSDKVRACPRRSARSA